MILVSKKIDNNPETNEMLRYISSLCEGVNIRVVSEYNNLWSIMLEFNKLIGNSNITIRYRRYINAKASKVDIDGEFLSITFSRNCWGSTNKYKLDSIKTIFDLISDGRL